MARTLDRGGRKPADKNSWDTERYRTSADMFREDLPEPERAASPESGRYRTERLKDGTEIRIANKPGGVLGALSSVFGLMAVLSLLATFAGGALFMGRLEEAGLAWAEIFLFGTTFLLFGLLILTGARSPAGLLFVAVGGCIAACAYIVGTGDEETAERVMSEIVPLLLMGAFAATGPVLLARGVLIGLKRKRTYVLEVRATVVKKKKETRQRKDADGHWHTDRVWVLTWKYSVNGREHTWRSNVGRSYEKRDVGDTGILRVDPSKPGDAAEAGPAAYADAAILAILGTCFALAGVFGITAFLGSSG